MSMPSPRAKRPLNRRFIVVLFLFGSASLSFGAQKNPRPLKPSEQLVRHYLNLIASGAELTPDGWKRTGRLFAEWNAEPPDQTIWLMTTGGAIGEDSSNEQEAQVETKWTDFLGTIDVSLRYSAPHSKVSAVMTVYQFRLVRTDKHTEFGPKGEELRTTTGPTQWKFADAPKMRSATPEGAAAYVVKMRDATNDPKIKKNAEQTLAILKRLGASCGACAC